MASDESNDESTLMLTAGPQIRIDRHNPNAMRVVSPDGAFELAIEFTARGPVIRVSATALELQCDGDLRIDCGSLAIRARDAVAIQAGSLSESIVADRTSSIGGESAVVADCVGFRARRGDVVLKANDNIEVSGERILLNS